MISYNIFEKLVRDREEAEKIRFDEVLIAFEQKLNDLLEDSAKTGKNLDIVSDGHAFRCNLDKSDFYDTRYSCGEPCSILNKVVNSNDWPEIIKYINKNYSELYAQISGGNIYIYISNNIKYISELKSKNNCSTKN